tara:strand:+ start:3186 stop:4508 length:1323 start_codon:yes stop_codon:yes gene_type:complete
MSLDKIKITIFIILASFFIPIEISAQRYSFETMEDFYELQNEEEYLEFLRVIVLEQPEFSYANAILNEAEMNLKYSRRQRLPELSMRVVNDEVLSRKIKENNALRKIRDDSFDGVVELRQAIYTGGGINAGVRKAKEGAIHISLSKKKTISQLIYSANNIYIQAISSYLLHQHAKKVLDELHPYLSKVKARVDAGIADPVEYALFSVRYNNIKSTVVNLNANSKRDISMYENFFKRDFKDQLYPKIKINEQSIPFQNLSFDVEMSQSKYKESIEDITIEKSQYRPQFGFAARFTKYDLDDNLGDEDVRGGLYFSYPFFDFGRSSARISGSKAKSRAAKNTIDIEKKKDLNSEAEFLSVLESATKSRNEIYQAFVDTQKQREIIAKRIEVSGFVATTLAETALQEINQLKSLMDSENNLLMAYFGLLHQNQILIQRLLMVF